MNAVRANTKWIRRPQSKPHVALRLLCFPYSGGSASSFRTWEQNLPEDVEACFVQLPGREDRFREPAFNQMGPLIDALEENVLPYLDRPYAIFGHSLGAVVGFELARQLRRHGHELPSHLFASSHRAPQLPHPYGPIHKHSDADFIKELRKYNGTPESILSNNELMRVLLPLIRADFTLYETYEYQDEEPLACRITAFGAFEDWKVSNAELIQWKEQTKSTFALHMFPGDHFYLHSQKEQLLQKIAKDLRAILSK